MLKITLIFDQKQHKHQHTGLTSQAVRSQAVRSQAVRSGRAHLSLDRFS